MSEKLEAVVFGAGKGALRAREYYGRWYNIVAFSGDHAQKYGECVSGLPIVAPSSVDPEIHDHVIIGSQDYPRVSRQLIEAGFPPERIIVADPEVLGGWYQFPGGFKSAVVFTALFGLALYGLIRLFAG